MRVLLWHVHGSWTTSFVRGDHEYLLPTLPEGGPWGRGRCGRDWPAATEVPADRLAGTDVDVVVLQREQELDLTREWLGLQPGVDVPAVFVEHTTPSEHAATTRHPLADQREIPLVHVTHFNDLMWDNGRCDTTVIEHGIVDPGHRYRGDLPKAAVLINEPMRRWRVTGTDLLTAFGDAAPIDVFGIGADDVHDRYSHVTGIADLPQQELHDAMARRRVYVHTARWTSLGLSLLEAMHLGMPVVAVASTEAAAAIPPEAGLVSSNVEELADGIRRFVRDPELAADAGAAAREFALTHYGLDTFLRDWDEVLATTAAGT
ncbi:MAG: glycosyltransferase [Actinophytocola sp.]|nr:glycosyltransferase [Actinophytocola sp.]